MGVVLVLGVQGAANALTLSKTSGDFQTKPAGGPFEITFSVRLDSNTTKIYNTDGRQVDEYGNVIDSSGYLVKYIGNSARRFISVNGGLSDANSLSGTASYAITSVALTDTDLAGKVLRVRGAGDRSSTSFGGRYSLTPDSNIYVDSSKNVVDSQNRAVYEEEERTNDAGTPADTADDFTQYKYTRAKATPVAPYASNAPQRYAYNDEQIKITSTDVTGIEMIHQNKTYTLPGAITADGAILSERDKTRGIPSRITLKITTSATSVGTHTVIISDDRATARQTAASPPPYGDYPNPKPVSAPITFTLYTTNETATGSITATDRFISTTRSTLRIDDDYTLPDNSLISYQVLSGPGTLYVGALDNPTRPATENLIAASGTTDTTDDNVNTPVFLYLNRGESRVRAYVDGGHPEDGATITYDYTGTDRQNPSVTPPTDTRPTIPVSSTSLSGAPGTTQSFTVTGGPTSVTVTGAGLTIAGSGRAWSVTLPNTPGSSYNLTVSATGYQPRTISVRVTGEAEPTEEDEEEEPDTQLGTLSVSRSGSQIGTQQTIIVSASPAPSANLPFTISSGGLRIGGGEILTSGSGRAIATVPATGLYILTISAAGYNPAQVSFTASGQQQQQQEEQEEEEEETEEDTSIEPDSIQIGGPSTRSGTVNTQLDAPLLVQVLDADDNAIEDARVIFRVRDGRGRLSQRGNGNAIGLQTDSRGYARADYTPLSARSAVEASVRGVTRTVTFTITATGSATGTGTDQTPDTSPTPPSTERTPTTSMRPVVNSAVDASSRPPMLWISDGQIYALVGSEIKVLVPGIENATNIAVGNQKVYWTAATNEKYGSLNSANLDGTGAKELRTLWGVPRGIIVDSTNSKLYWVDAANRLQRSNLDGSDIENVLRNLSDPKDLAISNGNAYWIGNGSGTDTLSYINLSDPRKVINPIAATSGTYGGLTIANGKLYWTEKTSDTHGKLHSANSDGTADRTELRDDPIWGAPIGIAVDTARSHLYWTDTVGRLQRSNLDGSGIHNVARGLGRPGDMVISNSITAPTPTTTTTSTGPNKYDVNGDGMVNKADRNAVATASLTENPDTKYDVNGDGEVDVLDVIAVADNYTPGAASAPALLGMKLTAVEIDRLQEQIDLLIASGDRSPAALKTLIFLQQLLATARPEKTQLLANYPNPFNPETWIPYELATDTDVRITIYNAQGVVIRTLQLGQQSAGYYTDRERAAYWDGRNAHGEQVASGIYFYQLETDEMSSLRKMVILK